MVKIENDSQESVQISTEQWKNGFYLIQVSDRSGSNSIVKLVK